MVEQVGNIRAAVYELRVEHLVAVRAKVSARCIGCRHNDDIDVFTLLRFGKLERLTDLESKLRCRSCGMRGFCNLVIEWLR